mgnify:CR=1 FL=1
MSHADPSHVPVYRSPARWQGDSRIAGIGGTGTPICGVTSLQIGTGWRGHYDGLIDDVKVFDRAVSVAEVAFAGSTCRLRPPEKEEGL